MVTIDLARPGPAFASDVRVETIDVVVAPSSAISNTPPAPVPPSTPPSSANQAAADRSPAPSYARGKRPRDSRSADAPDGAAHERARERTDVASVVPATRRPQPLVDRDQIDADAIFSPSFASDGTALFFQAESAGGSALKRAERGDSGVLHVATIVDDAAKNYHVKLSRTTDRWRLIPTAMGCAAFTWLARTAAAHQLSLRASLGWRLVPRGPADRI